MMQSDVRAGRLVGVIPLNQLDRAKSRLAGALTPAERAALVLALAERTLRALRDADTLEGIAVVSPDPAALAWAETHGAIPLRQPTADANGARGAR
ncbi:MAG TPA: hypothetical protein VID72_09755, partial [Ktedonobacterales bacterium]